MRKSIFLFGIILSACAAQSNLVDNRDGYALQMDEYNHDIVAGQSNAIALGILRSHAYVGKPIKFKIISPLPDGLTVTVNPNPVLLDTGTIELKSSPDVKKGVYTIVLSGNSLIPGMPAKGTVFKVTIN